VGERGVGKTALVENFESDKFKEDTKITIGVYFFYKDITIENEHQVRLQIWDFYTEMKFRFLLPTFVKGADGIMFVFSIVDKNSLSNFDEWLSIIRKFDPSIPILLIGSKIDLEHQRSVKKEEAIELCRSRGCDSYIEVSAKERINVEDAFKSIAKIMWDTKYST